MSHSIFEGSAAAVVTPMNGYGNLDFDAFGRLLEWMIREGTDAVVVNGTTGESATLDDKEKMAVIRYAVRQVDGRIPVIAGTGSNCTEHAVELSRKAQELGADVFVPYHKTFRDRLKVMGPCYTAHNPAVLANGKDRIAHHMPDTVLLQKQAVKTSSQIGCLQAVPCILFFKKTVSRNQGTAETCRHKIPVTRSMVIVPVASLRRGPKRGSGDIPPGRIPTLRRSGAGRSGATDGI